MMSLRAHLSSLRGRPSETAALLSAADEAAFQRAIGRECRDTMRRHAPFFMVLYVSFVLIDWILMPDMALYNVVSRAFVVTPLVVSAIHQFSGTPGSRADTVLIHAIASLVCGQFMLGSAMSASPYAFCYAFLAAITPITAFAGARLTSGHYAHFAGASCVVVIGVVLMSDFPEPVKIVTPLFIVSVAAIGHIGAISQDSMRRQMYAHTVREVAQRQVAEDAANHDPLTGLLNRRALERRLRHLFEASAGSRRFICVFMIDIDHFKIYNDTFGHMAGDACLRKVAEALQAQVRHGEICARYGGEEFIIVCDGCSLDDGRRIGERLVSAVRALALPHVAPTPGSVVTISCGLYGVETAAENLDGLVAHADTALYQAKRRGRNRLWFDGLTDSPAVALA